MRVLMTNRLILRPWTAEDLEDFHAYARDSRVGPAAGWKPCADRDESGVMLEGLIRHETAWAIVMKDCGRAVGHVKLNPDTNRGKLRAMYISYALTPECWGSGYMAEAAQAVIGYAFEMLDAEMISAFHYPENLRSRRVLEKCGFECEGIAGMARRHDGSMSDAVCWSLMKR